MAVYVPNRRSPIACRRPWPRTRCQAPDSEDAMPPMLMGSSGACCGGRPLWRQSLLSPGNTPARAPHRPSLYDNLRSHVTAWCSTFLRVLNIHPPGLSLSATQVPVKSGDLVSTLGHQLTDISAASASWSYLTWPCLASLACRRDACQRAAHPARGACVPTDGPLQPAQRRRGRAPSGGALPANAAHLHDFRRCARR